MVEEIWKSVVGYEGKYEVNNLGIVRSIPRKYWGRTYRNLAPNMDNSGYFYVSLSKDRQVKSIKIHRLVAMAFIDNPKGKPMINHKNGIKTDNRVENLEWCTNSENQIHARRVLKNPNFKEPPHYYGKENPAAKIVLKVNLFGEAVQRYECGVEARKELNISAAMLIYYMKNKKIVNDHYFILEDNFIQNENNN
jgi:hypothetical protein